MGIGVSQLHEDAGLSKKAFDARLAGVSIEERCEASFNSVEAGLAVIEGVNHTQHPILGDAHLYCQNAGDEKFKFVPSYDEVDDEAKIFGEGVDWL